MRQGQGVVKMNGTQGPQVIFQAPLGSYCQITKLTISWKATDATTQFGIFHNPYEPLALLPNANSRYLWYEDFNTINVGRTISLDFHTPYVINELDWLLMEIQSFGAATNVLQVCVTYIKFNK
jgi:hypothetical protein